MGNSLCKESNSSLHPGRVFDNFGSMLCPNGLGSQKTGIKKTYLNRHVLETGQKSNTMTSWRSTTLSSSDGNDVVSTPPVAPPRKKRATLERNSSPTVAVLNVKNGFKEVFAPDSRRPSANVPETTAEVLQRASSQSPTFEIDAGNDAFSDFSKVPTKAELDTSKSETTNSKLTNTGNKKSDKFFGVNLSDTLTIEPKPTRRRNSKLNTDELDKIDQFIEKNTVSQNNRVPVIEVTSVEEKLGNGHILNHQKEVDLAVEEGVKDKENEESLLRFIDQTVGKETSLGKKAEFLMAMLEDYPEDRYLGMTPVEEPVIVPRKRKSRHICDDDHHMHNRVHNTSESSMNLITTEASIETPPRKPNRDFSRYLAAMDACSDSDDSCTGPIRRPRTPTRNMLVAPPSPPKLVKSHSEKQFKNHIKEDATSTPKKKTSPESTKAHTPRTLKRIISMPSTVQLDVGTESRSTTPQPQLLKSSSSSSFLMKDLSKAHISVGRFTPEDHSHNAADELVKPKSRLAVRKISTKSIDSLPSTPTPTVEVSLPKFTIGTKEVVRTNSESLEPPAVPKRRKSSGNDLKQDPLFHPVSQSRPLPKEILGYDLGAFLEASKVLHHHDITNVIENVYNATDSEENIIREFQEYLVDQINAEVNSPNPQNPNTTKLLQALDDRKDEEKLDNVSIELVPSEHSIKSNNSDIDDCFDQEFEKIEKTEVSDKLGEIVEIKPQTFRKGRRESIDDMTDWFESGSEVGSAIEDDDKLGKMVSVKSVTNSRLTSRRESIEDVDSWFKHHNDALPGEEEIMGTRRQRRGSDGFLAYDTSRQYPFGVVQHRRESLSADMFEDITKLHEMGVSKDNPSSPTVKNLRLQERRGSDGLVCYDTTKKFPFGEPNLELPKALEALKNKEPNNEPKTPPSLEKMDETSKKDSDVNNRDKTPEIKAKEEDPLKQTNNEHKDIPATKANNEEADTNGIDTKKGKNDHSTLLKFLSKENLIE
ncbi:uncharacterized protein LOC129756792 [Uranotaenia lowii]|uniref:uncharacterized protein LOC129756792 n=1 Tax=Uranotaenia lowii TaxID=190385 RepID=UPI002478428C|nr:uncharacterized protein LOC129756792 [Uranotaenia lowii]XP_055609779.1 uncharacterized protein LOC129756792 [Uranotaenia lowii]